MTDDGPRVPPLEVRAIDDPQWLGFIEAQPSATPFHHPAWARVLADTYGYRPFALVQTAADMRIVAGVPLLELRRSRRPGKLASLPFTDYCPPLAATEAELASFTHSLLHWRDASGRRVSVIHEAAPSAPGVFQIERGVRHILPLDGSAESAFQVLGSKVRSSVRKSQREDVRVRISQSLDDLAPFYQLHLETRRRLGVPVQPKRFMENLFREMVATGLGFVVLAHKAERPIAAAVFLAWNRNLIYKYSASDHRFWRLRPNNLVVWTGIEWGHSQGFRLLDLGRTESDNLGLREFKSGWGASEVPLTYSYVAAPPESAPRVAMRAMARVIRYSPPIVCRALGELLYARAALSVG